MSPTEGGRERGERAGGAHERAGEVARAAAVVRRIVWARGYKIPGHEREDVFQEAMLRLWRVLSGPGSERIGSLEAFAATTAHRCCLVWLRRQRPLDPFPSSLADPSPSAEESLERQEDRALGLRVLRALKKSCRELLRLHALERLPYREIARRLNRSEHGLRTQMYECLREARRIAERLGRSR